MKRREFITLLGGAAATWPMAARTQQAAMPVIGFLAALGSAPRSLAAFHAGLKETGFVEGQNVAIEYRWSDDQYQLLPTLAADLASRRVAVIAAMGTVPIALAAKAATATIPIVFSIAADPIEVGLVSSLNRPGGNITGSTRLNVEVAPKRLELLHEALPGVRKFALLVNPIDPLVAGGESKALDSAANTLGLQLRVLNASTEREVEAVFATLDQWGAGGLAIGTNAFFTRNIALLAGLAARHKIPAINQGREFAAAGGLMSYGADSAASWRIGGVYVGRILKGEKPAELPVQQATKVELALNLKAAKALGITFPLTLLGRADGVIE